MVHGTSELFRTLSTLDSCEARAVSGHESSHGAVPPWCEIVLTLERDGRSLSLFLRRHDAELIISVLHEVLHPYTGKSAIGKLWEELDVCVDKLQSPLGGGKVLKGKAQGLAIALAYLLHPYTDGPDLDAIRAESVDRAEARGVR